MASPRPMPIQYSEILAFTELYDIIRGKRGDFAELIRRMDDVYLEIRHEQIERAERKNQ